MIQGLRKRKGTSCGALVYGVSTSDPSAYATMAVVIAASALAACWIPARRAAQTDPADVLRDE